MKVLRLLAFSLLLCLCVAGAFAQSNITSGEIKGTVVDANGAIIPGANIEITNVDTNFSKTVTSDGDGRFIGLLLPPGKYTVTATKSGFANFKQNNVEVTVGRSAYLPVRLGVAGSSETIVVTGVADID